MRLSFSCVTSSSSLQQYARGEAVSLAIEASAYDSAPAFASTSKAVHTQDSRRTFKHNRYDRVRIFIILTLRDIVASRLTS
jgi:hypothetical protein